MILADALATLVLATLAWTDLRSHRLPRPIMMALVLAGSASRILRGGLGGLLLGVLSAAISGVPLLLLRRLLGRRGVFGGGDIRLAAALGLWLGAPSALLVLTGGALASVAWGIGQRLRRRPDRVPYGTACAFTLFALALLQYSSR